ncbi:hypothetical protein L5515_000316 [Caenorhabditis briggsae]|uniref:Uncharacterized protein n=1 Tax=Caenorhabditis briggsae TaxID=6238 RepID=A0AAE9DZL7_CAEBR|nr:hypothetical protein L5515_000316 [Caenorhabditis briggsae]
MSIVYLLLYVILLFLEPINPCRVEECAAWFQKTKDYENLVPKATERYCQVLQTYLKCMNDTQKFCHGNLRFHSSELVMRRHWKEFECEKWESCNENQMGLKKKPVNTCYFNPPPSSRKLKYCSLFGDPHLIMFNGSIQTCSEEGARPLVDNRYFLVQVTNKNVRGEALTTTVTKVTVLIRKHNCSSSLHYEATSDEEGLPRGFVDGTTYQAKGSSSNSVEVLWQDNNYVEIALHFIHSSIHIRRQGPYLSVSVKAPSIVLETEGDVANEMCWAGCRRRSRIAAETAVEEPKKFAECYRRRVHVPKKVAEDRCRSVGTSGTFFDACIFDLMFTGDDYLVHLSRNAQSDFRRLAPHHFQSQIIQQRVRQQQEHNRNLHLNSTQVFDNCLPNSSPFSKSITNCSALLAIFLILIPIL